MENPPVLWIKRLHPDSVLPTRQYPGDVGLDLFTYGSHEIDRPRIAYNVPTGIAIAIPEGHYGQIIARSSTFGRYGLLVLPGILDSGWRGELMTQVIWLPDEWRGEEQLLCIEPLTRLAQLIINPIPPLMNQVVDILPEGERGELGFGSTGG